MRLIAKFSGWRTIAACAVIILLSVACAFGFHIPDWVFGMVGGLAGITHRLAVQKAEKAGADVKDLIRTLRSEAAPPPDAGPAPAGATEQDIRNLTTAGDLEQALDDPKVAL